jgi:uncharacterized protein YlzI (FlbEa/FlbD family)
MDNVIIVTRLGCGLPLAVNPDLIERAEQTPDTVITLADGHKLVVEESVTDLIELVRAWRASVQADSAALVRLAATPEPDGLYAVPDDMTGPVTQLHSVPDDAGTTPAAGADGRGVPAGAEPHDTRRADAGPPDAVVRPLIPTPSAAGDDAGSAPGTVVPLPTLGV